MTSLMSSVGGKCARRSAASVIGGIAGDGVVDEGPADVLQLAPR